MGEQGPALLESAIFKALIRQCELRRGVAAQTQAAAHRRLRLLLAEPWPQRWCESDLVPCDLADGAKADELSFLGAVAAEAVEEASPEGMDEKDIEIVMQQAGCCREMAIAALGNNNNDIVNSIMELTM